MARRHSWLLIALILIAGAAPLRASSIPAIQGTASGIELCEQAVCGSAIFVALFSGQVGVNPHAFGTIAVAVMHAPLPDPDDPPAALTGGVWQLQPLFGRKVAGIVTGGTLDNNGDNTFHVVAHMLITSGGAGTMTFDGTLSHNAFPPTIQGTIH
jgi:hypothetical protein